MASVALLITLSLLQLLLLFYFECFCFSTKKQEPIQALSITLLYALCIILLYHIKQD